jgi:SAM-dependent methyltransferase
VKRRAHYGIDAPGVFRAHLVLGLLLALTAMLGLALPRPGAIPASVLIGAASFAALLFYAAIMLASSLVGKKRVRDRLVAALALSGNERVLDAGCGLGLALVGCAKQLTSGKAVGIDLWASKDLSNNNADGTLANAQAEGVADRIEVKTGDITKLPFPDSAFDAVISMTMIHNIPSRELRDQALREFVCVLKPGGRIALFGRDLLWLLPCRSLLAHKRCAASAAASGSDPRPAPEPMECSSTTSAPRGLTSSTAWSVATQLRAMSVQSLRWRSIATSSRRTLIMVSRARTTPGATGMPEPVISGARTRGAPCSEPPQLGHFADPIGPPHAKSDRAVSFCRRQRAVLGVELAVAALAHGMHRRRSPARVGAA